MVHLKAIRQWQPRSNLLCAFAVANFASKSRMLESISCHTWALTLDVIFFYSFGDERSPYLCHKKLHL